MKVSLVLLPGLDGSGSLFQPLLRELPSELQRVVVSYPAQEFLGYPALKELVLRSVPADQPFFLLGESFSGPVAVLAAAERPKGLRGVILCASFVSPPRPWAALALPLLGLIPIRAAARALGQHMLMGRFKKPELAALMLAALAKVPEQVLRLRLGAAARVDVSAALRSLNCPSLYLQASEDLVVPKDAADVFSRVSRHGNVEVVAGPHFLLQCVPSDAAKSIMRFIERSQRGV